MEIKWRKYLNIIFIQKKTLRAIQYIYLFTRQLLLKLHLLQWQFVPQLLPKKKI